MEYEGQKISWFKVVSYLVIIPAYIALAVYFGYKAYTADDIVRQQISSDIKLNMSVIRIKFDYENDFSKDLLNYQLVKKRYDKEESLYIQKDYLKNNPESANNEINQFTYEPDYTESLRYWMFVIPFIIMLVFMKL